MSRVVVALAALVALGGCGADDETVVLMAASSLSDVFSEIETGAYTDLELTTAFAGSTTLVAQLGEGAEADILVTANNDAMSRAIDDGSVAGTPVAFATNSLALAAAPGNPGNVVGIDDLADPGLVLGLCAPEVPCGSLALEATAGLGVEVRPDTEEPNVRALAVKIDLGEVDAGLVYATDAAAFGLETVAVPGLDDFVNEYLIATVESDPPAAVSRFLDALLRDPLIRAVLTDAGFGAPSSGGAS